MEVRSCRDFAWLCPRCSNGSRSPPQPSLHEGRKKGLFGASHFFTAAANQARTHLRRVNHVTNSEIIASQARNATPPRGGCRPTTDTRLKVAPGHLEEPLCLGHGHSQNEPRQPSDPSRFLLCFCRHQVTSPGWSVKSFLIILGRPGPRLATAGRGRNA
jgi:hypothetical protein